MDTNDPNSFICRICRFACDPKTYVCLAMAIIATWNDLPEDFRNNEWVRYLRSFFTYLFISLGLGLPRPSIHFDEIKVRNNGEGTQSGTSGKTS